MTNLRFALRQLLKHPGFATAAVLSLALGIGANTALFSVIYGVVLNPYPYARPGEIWTPGLASASATQRMRSYRPDAVREMAGLPGFAEVMATGPGNVLLTGDYPPESLRAVRLSANAFGFLGVAPVLGRTLGPADVRSGGEPEPVVVLSYQLWHRLFDGRPEALGRTLRLDDQTYTVVGVMPPRFGWWTSDGLWLPMGTDSRDQRGVFPIVRLRRGVESSVAQSQLHGLHLRLAHDDPSGFPKDEFSTTLSNYLDMTVASGEMERSLQLLFGAVAFLLLIACTNVANMQLSRATSRAREMAIRLSIGARRGHLVRQLLTESVVLSGVGGVLGLVFAYWAIRLIVVLMPSFLVPNEARIEINGPVLWFSVVVAVFTGVLFGLAPALRSSRPDLVDALKDTSRGSGSAVRGGFFRGLLVAVQVAMAVVLLVSAGMTWRSFAALQRVDLGFQPDGVLMVTVPLAPARYATLEQRNKFARELLDRARSLPGVKAATMGNGGLPFGGPRSAFVVAGRASTGDERVMVQLVGEDHLRALGIPLRSGRMLTQAEVEGAAPVAVVNEAARGLWPAGEDPVGRSIRLELLANPGDPQVLLASPAKPELTIVGVVGDTRSGGLRSDPQAVVMVPFTLASPPQRVLAIRAQGDPMALLNPLRRQVQELDPEQPLARPITISEIVGSETSQPRFTSALFGLFAFLGLTLAAAGIYSLLSFQVSRRTHEIGVRLALGATRRLVLSSVFRAGGRLVLAGGLVGVLASWGVARVLRSRLDLFEVSVMDPVSILGMVVVLAGAAAIACYIPARRAARVDPMVALRSE